MTYARRYTLQAVAGVVGDPDDDGNEAAKTEGKAKAEAKKPAKEKGPYYRFLDKCKKLKAELGNDGIYYAILGAHGYADGSNTVPKSNTSVMADIVKDLEANIEMNKEEK